MTVVRTPTRINQIIFEYSDRGVLANIACHHSTDLIEDGVLLTTVAEICSIYHLLDSKELKALETLVKRLSNDRPWSPKKEADPPLVPVEPVDTKKKKS